MMKLIKVSLLLCTYMAIWAITTQAQERKSAKDTATTCEYIEHALEQALKESRETSTSMILVFRPGSREKSRAFSERRPVFIEGYVKFRDPTFEPLVIAQGSSNSEFGRLEIYVAGKVKPYILFRLNKAGRQSCSE